ncbi:response regulator transcription factor [Micromonospora yangpuensis]|uniref:Response regulator receiver domain-containing protein n=1 Tax=Micromonospora yangpuensis TaxID=683228 RepID=A0A1C6UVM2_9ACTN|nr:response regulator transcription factor [Micromonospora yangpuensis]GGM26038.1 hypothetical protein GCM10012279_50720 [Micromonospora yangpuensis]SCL58031.1 Response regulator receiver domain-containing protein [Micromonospora yangpuensis]
MSDTATAAATGDIDGRTTGRPRTISALIVHPGGSEQTALRTVLDAGERVRVLGLARDGREAVRLAHRLRPTVTLLDDRVTTPEGTDLVRALARRSRVIVLTGSTDRPTITAMLCRPIRGCLVYGQFEPADVLGAVRAVASGLGWLSPVAVAAASWSLRNPSNAGAAR